MLSRRDIRLGKPVEYRLAICGQSRMLPTGNLNLKTNPNCRFKRFLVVVSGVSGLLIVPGVLPAVLLPVLPSLAAQMLAPGCVAVAATAQVSWTKAFAEGETALSEQDLKTAEARFRNALNLVKKQSRDTADQEKCILKLGATLALLDRTDEAEALYRSLLNTLVKRYGAGSNQVSQVLMALGSIEESEGNHTVAMSYYQRALQINERNYGPYSPAVAGTLHRLGRVSKKSGNKQAAEGHYQRAITILSKDPNQAAADQLKSIRDEFGNLLNGNDNSDRDLVNDFREDILKDQSQTTATPADDKGKRGSPPDATQGSTAPASLAGSTSMTATQQSQWQRQSQSRIGSSRNFITDENTKVALRGLVAPSSDRTLGPAYKVVTDSIFKQNRYEKGEEYYQRMIAIDIDSLGPNHPTVGNDLNGLAQLYISQGRYKDAQPLLTRALSIYEQVYGSSNLLSIRTRATLASVESHLGQADKAAELYRSALGSGQSALGPNSLETARILNDLAYLYFRQGRLQEACDAYEMAVTSTEGAVGKKDALLAACLQDYAQVLRSLGRDNDASNAESRAEKILASAGN